LDVRLREKTGEITPATWLSGSVSAVTLGGVVQLAERWIGTTPAFIVFWCGCAVAALCLFGAGRQHYINIGRELARETAVPAAAPSSVIPSLAPPTPTTVHPTVTEIKYVACSNDTRVIFYTEDGYHHWSSETEVSPDRAESAIVVAFRHKRGPTAVIIAHVTYEHGGKEHLVHNGLWLGENTNTAVLDVGETAELLVAVYDGMTYAIIEDRRVSAGSAAITKKTTSTLRYAVRVELEIRSDSYEPEFEPLTETYQFTMQLDDRRGASIQRV
jgi:hypothetical protein